MKKPSLIFCGVYYFTVLVYTKTTIHLSVGGYSLRRSKYFPVSDWLAAPVDQIWKEHFFSNKTQVYLADPNVCLFSPGLVVYINELVNSYFALCPGTKSNLKIPWSPDTLIPYAGPNLPDAELHPSRLSHTSISGCRPVVQR